MKYNRIGKPWEQKKKGGGFHRLKTRITATLMAGMLGVISAMAAVPLDSLAWDEVDGTYRMPNGTVIEGVVARGIDVSHWKQNIDWDAVAEDDVQFVMLGTRYAGDVDPFFHTNAVNAANAGIKVGAYIYSYATTTQMAVEEADFVLNLIKDYPISFPVAFDVEASVQSTLAPSELSAIINAFCDRIKEAGYYPLVYANDYWLANKIDLSLIDYDIWVARYEVKHSYKNPVMWQATSTGSINGIQGNVDIDFLYQDLSSKLPADLWRTIGDKTYYYQNYQMQKDNWIHDGNGWYYMNSQGLASTGWLDKSGVWYYLDDQNGRMVTDWKQLGNHWYYFNESGSMATGWVQIGDSYYYLNTDGTMATGWLDHQNMRYYLKGDGSMATGWRQMDQAWYYFASTGEMAHGGWINPDGNWYYMKGDGQMQTGWLEDQNNHYYLSTNSGKMTIGWRELDGSWYYFNGSGAMVTGLTEINGLYYYLDPTNGKLAVSTSLTLDDAIYNIDANGVCSRVVMSESENDIPPQTQPVEIGPGV